MNDQTPEQPTTPSDPDAVATTVQPAVSEGPSAEAPKKNRFAWVSSPKVAAATVITVLALGGLGGAFALGRATAGHDPAGRIMVRVPAGFDGPGMQGPMRGPGMRGPDGGWGERGPMPERPQDLQDQAPQVTPSPSASSSTNG
jgi:hypothetical protein